MGKQLGISRAAIWKALKRLPELGLELDAVQGRGYRLQNEIEHLDAKKISATIQSAASIFQPRIEVLQTIDSTNNYLKKKAESGDNAVTVCLAEHQTGGRGRRGRYWFSPYGSNLYLSLLWRFEEGMGQLQGLSLAVAVALMRSFTKLGAIGLAIKWPNDIISDEGKVAGILVDVAGESSGPCNVVLGIGVNYNMPHSLGANIDQPWSSLNEQGVSTCRNDTASAVISELLTAFSDFEQQGFSAFLDEWRRWDGLRDQKVTIHTTRDAQDGVARGITEQGLLRLEQGGEIRHYAAGDVSLRKR